MRAATAIVGAIAVASILIAVSLIVSGGGDSGQTVVTKTVVEEIKPPEIEDEAGADAEVGGPTPCGTKLSVENTSCEVGEQIHADYAKGRRGELFAKDKDTGGTIAVLCEGETSPITCKGEEGVVVYFEP